MKTEYVPAVWPKPKPITWALVTLDSLVNVVPESVECQIPQGEQLLPPPADCAPPTTQTSPSVPNTALTLPVLGKPVVADAVKVLPPSVLTQNLLLPSP